MKHIISTKFNLGIYDRRGIHNKGNLEKIDVDRWLYGRVELFKKFTLPSMYNQTCKNFTWYIHLDQRTPPKHVEAVETAVNNTDNVIISMGTNIKSLYKFITNRQTLFLMNNLDSDDMEEVDYIERIQRIAENYQSDKQFIIDTGALLRITPSLSHYQTVNTSIRKLFIPMFVNSCYVLVTPRDCTPPVEMYCRNHAEARPIYSQHLTTDSIHCQVVHDFNYLIKLEDISNQTLSPLQKINDRIKQILHERFGF